MREQHTAHLLRRRRAPWRACITSSPENSIRAQKAAQIGLGVVGGILAQPVDQVAIKVFEIGGVVLGEVALADGHAPLEAALVGLDLAHQNPKQGGVRALSLSPTKAILSPLSHGEGHVVQHLHAVHGLGSGSSRYRMSLPASRSRLKPTKGYFRLEAGICFHRMRVQHLLAAGGLTALGLVGGKAADQFCSRGSCLPASSFCWRISCWNSWLESYQKS